MILLSMTGVTEIFVRDRSAGALPLPLIVLAVMMAAIGLIAYRTSTVTLAIYLLIGAVCIYLFLYSVLAGHPYLLPAALVLLNRPALALVLVGTAGARPLVAIAWGAAGFLVGAASTALVEFQLGIPVQFGYGPALALANYTAAYLGLSFIQRAQRRRVPDFLQLRRETRRIEAARTKEHRAVALLHDTVLTDLALLINGPGILDTRAKERILRDVATLATSEVLEPDRAAELVESSDAALRNQMMSIVSDFQWRGLTVEATGDTGTVMRMTPDAIAAAGGALRASLENILAHSGVDSAEIIVSATDSSLTWTVSDAGRGFDTASVASDRLGFRSSIVQRVESAGGTVRVWSSPGRGTTVLFTLPLLPSPDSPAAESGDEVGLAHE
jgi:signal transduction histidine kinase